VGVWDDPAPDLWAPGAPVLAPVPGKPQFHQKGCLTVQDLTPSPGWHAEQPERWTRAIRPVKLTAPERAVAMTLATYANKKDGKNAHPSLPRMAWASSTSVITARRTLAKLQWWWLIHCNECGNGRGHATVWWLTVHNEIDSLGTSFEDWLEVRE
jgi:hypothetical protein